jgi:hypothetical protein
MATDFTVFSRAFMKSDVHDSDVKMISAHIRNIVSGEVNTLVPIPWENVRLVKAVASITEAVDAVADWEIDLELNAAAGTEMMTITIAASAAVGAVYEATVTTESACQNLSAAIAARDAINIESDGSATPTGAANLYFYFEPELDTV